MSRDRRHILVTGGAGFIGASVVRGLEASGDRVRVLDSGEAAGLASLDDTQAEIIVGDLREVDLDAVLRGVDSVVHLAAQTSVPLSMTAPLGDLMTNVVATVELLEAVRRAGIRRFVFASSCAAAPVTGPGRSPEARVGAVTGPMVPYGAGKLAAEAYLQVYASAYGIATTSLRLGNVYGPFSMHTGSVVTAFMRHHLAGAPMRIEGDGSQTRDFIHVQDVVDLTLTVLAAPEGVVAGRVIPAGTGQETSIDELAALLIALAGRPVAVVRRPGRPGDVSRSVIDTRPAAELLGWSARISLGDGLARTLAWFAAEHDRGTTPSVPHMIPAAS